MQARTSVLTVILIGAALLASGCSRNASPPAEPAADAAGGQPRGAKVLPLPGETAPPAAPGPQAGPLVWDMPAGWTAEPPASNMRRAQYRVPGPGGAGECIVFYFGPGQGGDPAGNAVRWAGQFQQPDGGSSVDRMLMAPLDGAQVPVRIVEVTGTYDGGMTMTDAPAESKTGYMLLGGIAESSQGPWFFKFTGPESTVRSQRAAFEAMLRSLRAGS